MFFAKGKKWKWIGAAGLLLLMGACSSPEEKTFNHLEEAASLEDSFQEQQQPLMELENKEKKLYEEMLSLDLEESDRLKKLSEEAVGYAEERQELVQTEKESIDMAYDEFTKAEESLTEVEGALEEAKAVQEAMIERYEAYQSLYESYSEAIEKDIKIYKSFLEKELTLEELQSFIDAANEKYEEVAKHRQSFNNYTDQFNEAKISFYEAAGFDVNTEGTEEQKSDTKDDDK